MLELPECRIILDRLENELPPHLQYHTIHHTLDVYHCAEAIAKAESVSAADLKLLLVAAVYHDSGYLDQNHDHELRSCELARIHLPDYHYSEADINVICGIIMATKIPQQPNTHLEQIICDADLDYLGRDDFFIIGEKLYEEMITIGTIKNRHEWDRLQVTFLKNHYYFTDTSIRLRQAGKDKNLKITESKLP
jgi:uncharacterized protein